MIYHKEDSIKEKHKKVRAETDMQAMLIDHEYRLTLSELGVL